MRGIARAAALVVAAAIAGCSGAPAPTQSPPPTASPERTPSAPPSAAATSRYVVEPMAAKHGFTLVDTQVVFNGPTRRGMPADGLFLPDGLHPSPAGAVLIAQVFADTDGLGD
jgi:hypothetical protein